MNEGPGSGFLARTGSSSLVFIPPPQKKILLGLRGVGPFMILFSHFFPCKMCMVFLCTDLLFDLGTPVHASAAAVCWVFGSGAGLLLLAWNVKYSSPGINVVYNLTLSKLFIWTYANRLLPHTAGKF